MDPTYLPAEQRVALDAATRFRTWQIVAQAAVAATGVISVLTDNHTVLYALAWIGVGALVVWLWLDQAGRDRRDAGERFRRATLVAGGLGHRLAPSEELVLTDASKATRAQLDAVHDPAYYASRLPVGPARVAEMLEESAFWTSKLQAASARYMAAIFVVLAILAVVASILVIPRATTEELVTATRIVLALVVFFLSSDVYGAAVGHWTAAREVEAIRQRLVCIQSGGCAIGDVLILLGDYNSAVERAPLTLSLAYHLHRDRLNEQWARYLEAKEAARNGGAA